MYRELSISEVDEVTGGNPVAIGAAIIAIAIAVVAHYSSDDCSSTKTKNKDGSTTTRTECN